MYFFNDNYEDMYRSGVKEGGIVRNSAWIRFLKEEYPNIIFVDFAFTNRVLKYINYVHFLIKARLIKGDTIFLLYPKVGLPILTKGKKGKIFRKLFLGTLSKMIKNGNKLIFDISDIKYEQAIDLELQWIELEEMKAFEKQLFSLNQFYIFASYAMREYVVKNHSVPYENTEVCINGGYIQDSLLEIDIELPNTMRFVYAGTLNKGRMIERMIDNFPEIEDRCLILLGTAGEWIEEYVSSVGKKNVIYLGAFEEDVARQIVSKCDMGVIPYDDTRLYYNIAYPTKLSFYITAGIPFLSTPVREVSNVLKEMKLGIAADIGEWKELLTKLKKDEIEEYRRHVNVEKNNFTWMNIFSKSSLIKVEN